MPQPGSPVEQRQTNSLQVSHGGYQDDSLSRLSDWRPRPIQPLAPLVTRPTLLSPATALSNAILFTDTWWPPWACAAGVSAWARCVLLTAPVFPWPCDLTVAELTCLGGHFPFSLNLSHSDLWCDVDWQKVHLRPKLFFPSPWPCCWACDFQTCGSLHHHSLYQHTCSAIATGNALVWPSVVRYRTHEY